MSYCDAEPCKVGSPGSIEGQPHSFAGYGWYATFHPECCPGAMDGSPCFQIDDGHPEGWQPEHPASFEEAMAHYNKPWTG